MFHKFPIQFCQQFSFEPKTHFNDLLSFDLRNNRSKHWMDKDVFQERAFFHSQKTTSINAAGVPIVVSYLQINQVRMLR